MGVFVCGIPFIIGMYEGVFSLTKNPMAHFMKLLLEITTGIWFFIECINL